MSKKDKLPKCVEDLATDTKMLWEKYGKWHKTKNRNGPYRRQEDLGRDLVKSYAGKKGVSQSCISQFFNHHIEIPRGQLLQILRLCNVPQGEVNQLFNKHRAALGYRRLDYKEINLAEQKKPGSLIDPIEYAAYIQGSLDTAREMAGGEGGLLCRKLKKLLDQGLSTEEITRIFEEATPW